MNTFRLAIATAAVAVTGCSSTPTLRAAPPGFVLETTAQLTPPALRLNAVRVVNRHPDIKKPVLVSTNGAEEATVTFAVRDGAGVKMAFETTTLDARIVGPYTYTTNEIERIPRPTAARTRVDLEGGWRAVVWVDDTSSTVLAQVTAADGTKMGDALLVSPPSMQAATPPRAISADGKHVVVTFYTTGPEGFELVAAALEANR